MIPLLAQSPAATPPADALKSFLEVAFYLVGGLTACVVLWKHLTGKSGETRITPTPLEVKEHTQFATSDELARVEKQAHGRMNREREESDRKTEAVAKTAADRADKLEKKIDDNTALTATTAGIVKQLNQNVAQLTTAVTSSLQAAANHSRK